MGLYIQLCAPKVVARAVRMVMRMLRIFPQVELLLNVPIVLDVCLVRLDIKVNYQDPPVWRLHFVTSPAGEDGRGLYSVCKDTTSF